MKMIDALNIAHDTLKYALQEVRSKPYTREDLVGILAWESASKKIREFIDDMKESHE